MPPDASGPDTTGSGLSGTEVNHRVLLVDDSPAIHEDLRKILAPPTSATADLDQMEAELFGTGPAGPAFAAYDIESAYQGAQALDMTQTALREGRPFAVAFVDVRMPPGWDGIETIERLWREDPDLQVVICTAFSDHSWADIVRRLAPSDGLLILRKPFDSVEIRQMAHALTAKWTLQAQARRRMRDLQGEVQSRTAALVETTRRLQLEAEARARMETELRLAQKLEGVGQIATGIAHEITTPVHFVGESAELLRHAFAGLRAQNARYRAMLERLAAREGIGVEVGKALAEADQAVSVSDLEEDISESLERTLEGTSRIATIVRAMKEFMHPDRREKAPADLNRALLNTLTVARHEYKYVARVETVLGELPSVICHVGDLNQVFLNLIVNAAQAVAEVVPRTRTLGLIRVRSFREGDHVVVEVSDTGPGIPEEIRPHVFEPFFTTKPAGKGTGQGLAIARAIVVDRHQGSIVFTSEMGRGTAFTVRLPIEPPEPH